jgi:pimeloyl-ACP methyl ester carboxylesterase
MVEAAGVPLAYEERGEGPAVLLVHGMAEDARGWVDVVAALAGSARTIAYDRRGYGRSGAPDPYERTTVSEQAEDAAVLLDALGAAPAVVCGRDFGALVCLDLVKRHRHLVRAAVVVDVPLYAFVPAATEALSAQRIALEEALRAGGPEAAVATYRASAGRGGDAGRAGRVAPAAFFADYGGLASWPVTRGELRGLAVPLAVLTTADAPVHVRQAADALAALVPGARRGHDEEPAAAVAALLS